MSRAFQSRVAPPEPAVPLVEELTPAPDPWEVARRLAHLPHLLFLDSATEHPLLGHYSFVTADPFDRLWARGCQAGDPFAVLAVKLAQWKAESVAALPPFQGGAAGLFGYDLCHHIERLPRPRRDEFQAPDMAVGFYDWVVGFDHTEGRAWLVSTGLPEADGPRRRDRAAKRLAWVRGLLSGEPAAPPLPRRPSLPRAAVWAPGTLPDFPAVRSSFDRAGYLAAVRRAIDYIRAGDCFQVNLAQRLLHPATLPALELYRRLRERNPAPFAGYFDTGDFAVASASPERFVRVEGGEVETRPIKGTRPRGATPEEDRRRADELLRSAKDRAENVMIVDLLRNDLGRVCAYGSVRVEAVCRLETYRHGHHLVSEVRGRLRE
ncbi:MAG TPA: anthranilate synthase component I family protein, partial [Gemmataceae bacterium]|nr:anthranilate synthase component I family protein [Gemmataceae bacterium]